MRCFATRNGTEFSLAMLRYVSATAGLITPDPGRTHFNLSPSRGASPQNGAAGEPVGVSLVSADRQPFNTDACFNMVEAVTTPERVVEVRT